MKLYCRRAVKIALITVLVLGAGACGKYKAGNLGISPPEYRVRVEKNVMVPMRDGVRLAANIYFPVGMEKAPVVLIRTPYSKDMMGIFVRMNLGKLAAQRGYIVVIQDVRGRYKSEGEFYPFINEGGDGVDTIAWIEDQTWYGGKLGTAGGSYFGITQWLPSPGQDIDAMFLSVTSPDIEDWMYRGGQLNLQVSYFAKVILFGNEHKAHFLDMGAKIARFNKLVSTLPLSEADERAGYEVNYFDPILDPLEMQKVYPEMNFDNKYQKVSAPAVFVAGWYDLFLGPQLEDFNRLSREGRGKAKDSVLIVGPWSHGGLGGGGGGCVDYGPEAMTKELTPPYYLPWFDYRLKGIDNDVRDWPRVKIFVMGDNQWRDENEWPLARTLYTNYYLHSEGNANTRSGHGVLSTKPPASDEPEDSFSYNPLDPVPTLGGNNLFVNIGAKDQSEVEDREDVLCFTTPVLKEDVEVTGPIKAVLYAASDAKDTDFTVKLVDVYPDGTPINIQDGIVRAMYQDNNFENPAPLKPGAVEKYTIDMWASSNVFKAGHRIRVEVSSSNFPRYNRNLNIGEPIATAVHAVVAHQTIYHNPKYPSHIILPIIPR